MAINWTKEQKAVIESRNRNLLVSAAAGSGKTAVLVERIIRMITEGENPLNIDELLVMTFTKAAADEMRERVLSAIDEKLQEDPENGHLQMQAAMIPYARITTIDSFCLGIIREHYNKLAIDPAFRVGDEGELILLKASVMEELIEDYYQSEREDFFRFVETYATGKADQGIEDRIMAVYYFSESNSWPFNWLLEQEAELAKWDGEHLMETKWMKFLFWDVKTQVDELFAQMSEALLVCEEEDGPAAYESMIVRDLAMLKAIGEAEDYENLNALLSNVAFDRLASVRGKSVDPQKKGLVTGCRDRVKKAVGKLKELYSFESVKAVTDDLQGTAKVVRMLLELAGEFRRRYQAAKQEKDLVDFGDLEHFALEVLLEERDGERVPSAAADELSGQFEEILVDEYQDSNDVQETLIQAISRERLGTPNVFMVGDVKQSIYKFRLARPELFLKKYESYPREDGLYQTMELHQNFRSRDGVLEGINQVFYRIMTKALGGITYTEETALYPGAFFEPCDGSSGEKLELLMVNTGSLKELNDDSADYTAREMEARLIAAKIKEMVHPETGLVIWDKEGKRYRTARYKDMVILLRSLTGFAEDFVNVLVNQGIPAYAERRTGYFTTVEVETILCLLSIIDNPMKDIPLAAVMKSPIGEVTDEELSYLMARFKKRGKKGQDRGIYGAWRLYLAEEEGKSGEGGEVGEGGKGEENGENGEGVSDSVSFVLYKKLANLSTMVERYRHMAGYLTIHELLYAIYEDTGYYDYVSAMPAGGARQANLDMLVEKAVSYEKTSYSGLFHFIRYIEKLKKYNMDFGEAALTGEEEAVRILSIHKSKGLEFPIVFLGGMGKKFNKQDLYGKILIDSEFGIGTDFLDLELRVRIPTLKKNVLKRRLELDSLGEELRVLYVAMTRAKEKLVMTGTDRYLNKKLERFAQDEGRSSQTVGELDGGVMGDGAASVAADRAGVADDRASVAADGAASDKEGAGRSKGISFTLLSTADSYLDWLLMSLSGSVPSWEFLSGSFETETMKVREAVLADFLGEEIEHQAKKRLTKDELLNFDCSRVYDQAYGEGLLKAFSYRYPHEADIGLCTKISVSELKKRGQFVDEEESGFLPEISLAAEGEGKGREKEREMAAAAGDGFPGLENDIQPVHSPVHGGMAGKKQNRGAYRGTAYHRALELLDFSTMESREDVERALSLFRQEKRMDEESLSLLDSAVLWAFLCSPLGISMGKAQKEGRLHKEQQFVIGIPAREMKLCDSDELVLIQGIIDAYIEEEAGLVLVDYKTDRVAEGGLASLAQRYAVQLEYYKRALEQMTGKKVWKKVIYSLTLQEEILL